MDADSFRIGRDRLLRVFRFLQPSDTTTQSPVSTELTDRVCRRAEQLRQEWNVRNGSGTPA